jgi:ABC-type antimicrobial peptide transport system permease subunit
MAIGATRTRVARWVIADSAWVTALGAAIGLVVGLLATRAIASLLYGVTFDDAGVIVGSVTVVLTTATFAAFIPAGRATRHSPVEALRHD